MTKKLPRNESEELQESKERYLSEKQSSFIIASSLTLVFIINFIIIFCVYYFYPKNHPELKK